MSIFRNSGTISLLKETAILPSLKLSGSTSKIGTLETAAAQESSLRTAAVLAEARFSSTAFTRSFRGRVTRTGSFLAPGGPKTWRILTAALLVQKLSNQQGTVCY